MRKLRRSVARHNMLVAGYYQINKRAGKQAELLRLQLAEILLKGMKNRVDRRTEATRSR